MFPNLTDNDRWRIKSPFDKRYNCIAWAAGDITRRWWPTIFPPVGAPPDYWPVEREETVECFVRAFATLGYMPCESGDYEFGYQKVAIYADSDLTPTHMARQSFWGGWLSKLGDYHDIFHPRLVDVEGDTSPEAGQYGIVVKFIKRSWWSAIRHRVHAA